MKRLGFIGVGAMGGTLAAAACRQLPAEEVIVFDVMTEKAKALSASTGCICAGSMEEVIDSAAFVMFCIKPQILENVLKTTLPFFKKHYAAGEKRVVASIAAGYTLEDITTVFHSAEMDMPVIRLLPNTPVAIGKGLVLFANNEYATDGDVDELRDMLQKCGMCEHTEEELLPIACPVFSCSPAFTYMYIESLADGSVQIGMRRDQATKFAAQAVLGAAAMVLETGKHIGQLKDELSTPGGMTIGGTNIMEQRGFRGAAIQGILTAYERQDGLAK